MHYLPDLDTIQAMQAEKIAQADHLRLARQVVRGAVPGLAKLLSGTLARIGNVMISLGGQLQARYGAHERADEKTRKSAASV